MKLYREDLLANTTTLLKELDTDNPQISNHIMRQFVKLDRTESMEIVSTRTDFSRENEIFLVTDRERLFRFYQEW